MLKRKAFPKPNKPRAPRHLFLAFERLGTRALLSATPSTPALADLAVPFVAIPESFTGTASATAIDALPAWTKPILTLNAAGNIEVIADPGVTFTVEYVNPVRLGQPVSKVLQGTGEIQEIDLSPAERSSLGYNSRGGIILVSVAGDYPVPAGYRMPDNQAIIDLTPAFINPEPVPVTPTPSSPVPVPSPEQYPVPAPALTASVRNVVHELRAKRFIDDDTEQDDPNYPPYLVTVDGIVDVSGLVEDATWQYSLDGITWTSGSGASLTLPAEGPQKLSVRQVRDGTSGFLVTLYVVVDPDWNKPVLSWSGTIPDHYHVWYGSRFLWRELPAGPYAGTIWESVFTAGHGTAKDIIRFAQLTDYSGVGGYTGGLLIDRTVYRGFLDFLPKTQRDRQDGAYPRGTPLLLNGKLFVAGSVTVAETILSLEVFLQQDLNGDGSVAGRPASAGGVRIEESVAEMSTEVAGDTQFAVYAARGIPGVTGRVYIVGQPGLTADNTYEAGDLEDYKVLRLSNGKPVASPSVPVALRPSASGVEVLFRSGAASGTYQSRVFSLQSGRAIGKPSAISRDVGVLEAEYATDINGDGVIGNAITIAQVLDSSDREPDAADEATIGLYRASGVPGVGGTAVVVGDANLQSGETYLDADLGRLTLLRGTNGKPLGAAITPVAVRDDGAHVEVLFRPSPSSAIHQTQRFNAVTGRATGRPSKPIRNLVNVEVVFAQDLNADGVIGAAFTVVGVVDNSGAADGGGPGNYGLYWVTGFRQGPTLIVSDPGLVAEAVYQEGDVATTVELVSRKGAALASTFPVVAIRESAGSVHVLYRVGAAYQTQQYSLTSGRPVGPAGPVRSDVPTLEEDFDQDLDNDGKVGGSVS